MAPKDRLCDDEAQSAPEIGEEALMERAAKHRPTRPDRPGAGSAVDFFSSCRAIGRNAMGIFALVLDQIAGG
jgi:hypothetical protein